MAKPTRATRAEQRALDELDAAEQNEAAAIAKDEAPTRAAASLLLSADAAELERLIQAEAQVIRRMRERLRRQNRLPRNHSERMGYGELGALIDRDPMQVKRWIERLEAEETADRPVDELSEDEARRELARLRRARGLAS